MSLLPTLTIDYLINEYLVNLLILLSYDKVNLIITLLIMFILVYLFNDPQSFMVTINPILFIPGLNLKYLTIHY